MEMIGYAQRQLEDGKWVVLCDGRKRGSEKIAEVQHLQFQTRKPFEDDHAWLKDTYNEEYVPVYALPDEPSEELIDSIHSKFPFCQVRDLDGTCTEITRKMYKAFLAALK